MDGSSPFFFDDGDENQLTFFFSWGTLLFKHVLSWLLWGKFGFCQYIQKHPVIMASNYCHCVYQIMFTSCLIWKLQLNAFEITDGVVPDFFYRFSGNFIVQWFKEKRREFLSTGDWTYININWKKYASHLYMSDVANRLAKAQTGGITRVKARYTIDPVS